MRLGLIQRTDIGLISVSAASQSCSIGIGSEKLVSGHTYLYCDGGYLYCVGGYLYCVGGYVYCVGGYLYCVGGYLYLVQLVADPAVELPPLHAQEVVARVQDAALEGDGPGSVDVVPGYHAHRDARALTLPDGVRYLGQR